MEKTASYNFHLRIQQLIECLPELSLGHRERLLRPLKGSDVHCWGTMTEGDFHDVMKVCLRTVSHEVVDGLCVQLEATLADRPSEAIAVLQAALLAYLLPTGLPVLIRMPAGHVGYCFPSAEVFILQPPIERSSGSGPCLVVEHLRMRSAALVDLVSLENDQQMQIRRLNVYVQDSLEVEVSFASDAQSSQVAMHFTQTEVHENPFRCAATAVKLLLEQEN